MKKLLFLSLIIITISSYSQDFFFTFDTVKIDEVTVVSSYSASRTTPFTFKNLKSEEISLRSMNSEPAVLLGSTPSITFYSDNGTGLGYIYYRLRGIDQTRINATFNGVPLNEPEDQGIYFNNFPGLLNSVSSVQIIRGAGLSKPGVASYGGSINFEPLQFSDNLEENFQISGGSYNTFLGSIFINTAKFFMTLNMQHTDGYKYNVFNMSGSAFYGTKLYERKNSSLIWYGFYGSQKNGMGWLGETLEDIEKDPRTNSNTPEETDAFKQVHNQLVWKYKNLKITGYHTYSRGGYGIDGVHYGYEGIDTTNVKFNWLGASINYFIPINNVVYFNTGVNGYAYVREHFGDKSFWYKNIGYKNTLSPYVKTEIKINKFSLYGDVQYRYSELKVGGFDISIPEITFPSQYYNFVDWSAGVNYQINSYLRTYYGIGKTSKEPKRYDYFGGWEYFIPSVFTELRPEKLLSNELGMTYNNLKFSGNLNVFYMKFKDEMSLTGNLGYNALTLSNINIDKSFRSGVEIEAKYKFFNGIEVSTFNTFSYNRITEGEYTGQPVLTPTVISSFDVMYNKTKYFIGSNIKYNSSSYIDFNNEYELPSYTTINLYAGLSWKSFELKGYLNNITNNLILGSAYMNMDGAPRYFAMAGRNALISLKYSF